MDIRATREFQRKIRFLIKRYRHIQADLQPILEKLSSGEILGDRIPGINSVVYKLRVRNSDAQRGKSGGYRLIYWFQQSDAIVLLDIYSKSDQENSEIESILQIIKNFE